VDWLTYSLDDHSLLSLLNHYIISTQLSIVSTDVLSQFIQANQFHQNPSSRKKIASLINLYLILSSKKKDITILSLSHDFSYIKFYAHRLDVNFLIIYFHASSIQRMIKLRN
jgi:hypothetical protein